MYCTQCGAEYSEDSAYCAKCGSKLADNAVGATPNQEQPATSGQQPESDIPSAAPELDEGQERLKTRDPAYVRPWIRMWARFVDIVLFGIVGGGLVAGLIWPELMELSDVVVGIITMAVWIPIEPLFLSRWGATPGKALFRIRVLALETGRKLSYSEALNRSVNVWFRGTGLGLPVVSLVTEIVAYQRLTSQGVTSWDSDSNSVVTHADLGIVRVLLIILVLLAVLGLIILGSQE